MLWPDAFKIKGFSHDKFLSAYISHTLLLYCNVLLPSSTECMTGI